MEAYHCCFGTVALDEQERRITMAITRVVLVSTLIVFSGATYRMMQLMEPVGQIWTMPDAQFGFTAVWLRTVCADAVWRQAYLQAAAVDLFPYMVAYTVIMWCFTVYLTERLPLFWKRLGFVCATLPVVFDVIETTNLRTMVHRECSMQEGVTDEWIKFTSVINQLKYLSFAVYWFAVLTPNVQSKLNGPTLKRD